MVDVLHAVDAEGDAGDGPAACGGGDGRKGSGLWSEGRGIGKERERGEEGGDTPMRKRPRQESHAREPGL